VTSATITGAAGALLAGLTSVAAGVSLFEHPLKTKAIAAAMTKPNNDRDAPDDAVNCFERCQTI